MNNQTDPPELDFNLLEDVLIETILDSRAAYGWKVIQAKVLHQYRIHGAASYEACEGFLIYAMKDALPVLQPGFYVVEGVHANTRTEYGWITDNDIRLLFGNIRPATEEEIKQI